MTLYYLPSRIKRRYETCLEFLSWSLLLLIFFSPAFSPDLFSQTFSFQSYTIKEGLPSNQINSIYQDSRGYLWIGTNNGLSVYDGASFTNYSVADGLTNNWVSWIVESPRNPGTMWIGSATGGVCKFSDGKIAPVFQSLLVNYLFEDREGTLWCTTDEALYRIRDSIPEAIERGQGTSILQTTNGDIWIAMHNRVSIYSKSGHLSHTIDLNSLLKHGITTLQSNGDRIIYAVAPYDSLLLALHDTSVVASWHDHVSLPDFAIHDESGYLWTRDPRGLIRLQLRGGTIQEAGRYEVQDLPPTPDWVGPILLDRESNLWVGTWTNGLLKVTDRCLVKFPIIPIGGGAMDSSGHLWFTNAQGLWEIFKSEDQNWHTSFHGGVLKDNVQYKCRGVDSSDRLWIVSTQPLEIFCYKITTQQRVPSLLTQEYRFIGGMDFPTSAFMVLMVDKNERLWLSLDHVILYVIDLRTKKRLRTFDLSDNLPGESIRAIFEDREGNIWAGDFSGGLAVLEARPPRRARQGIVGKFKKFTTADGLPDNRIRAIFQDRDGQVWIGTRYGGLALYDAGKFRTFSIKDGIRSNSIWGIVEDSESRLWLSTDVGLECLDRKTMHVLPLKPEFRGEKGTGFGCYRDDYIWSASIEGVKIYEYSQKSASSLPPPIYITSLRVKGQCLEHASDIQLQHDQNDCTIEYIGISYRDESAVRYQYRMLGVDTVWSRPIKERSVTYASLKPGTYAFEVKAINWGGIVTEIPARLSLTILPPFWQRWWFIALIVVGVVSATYGAVRRKVANLEQRRALQEEFSRRLIDSQERERTRVAAELHDSLGQNLLVIQNQALLAIDAHPEKQEILNRLNDISTVTTQTIEEVREISHNLRPYHLDKLGLTTSIQSIIRRISESSKIAFTPDIDFIDSLFSKEEESHIYRIVQEGVSNIIKHSQATEASISVKRHQKIISVAIRDNGKGFAKLCTALPSPEDEPHGFGLIGLGERVRILNGNISFGSTPGRGTTLVIDIPFKGETHG